MTPLDWRTMTDAINKIKPAPRMLQDLVFRTRNTNPTKSIEADITIGGRKLAPLVRDTEGARVVEGTVREQREITTARIRIKRPLNADYLLTTRTPGDLPYIPNTQVSLESQYLQLVGTEQAKLRNMIDTRIEHMCAQALTGKIDIVQDNISYQVDYRMPAENKIVLATGSKWNEAGGDPEADIQTAADIIDNAGHIADLVIYGRNAAAALRSKLEGSTWFDYTRLSAGELTWSVSSAYIGSALGLSHYRYGKMYETDAGVDTNLIDPDKVYVIATGARISLEFGLILDTRARARVQAEYFSKQWEEEDPSGAVVLAESRPVPMIWEPDAIVELDVL